MFIELNETDEIKTLKIKKQSNINISHVYTDDFFNLLQLKRLPNDLQKGGSVIGDFISNNIINPLSRRFYGFALNGINNDSPIMFTDLQNESNQDIILSFSKTTQIDTLDQIKSKARELPQSVFCFENTGSDEIQEDDPILMVSDIENGINYEMIDQILNDLTIQLDYLEHLQISVSSIDFKTIYRIQKRYLLLNPNGLKEKKPENKIEDQIIRNRELLNILSEMCNKIKIDKVEVQFKEIKGTDLFKKMKNLENKIFG